MPSNSDRSSTRPQEWMDTILKPIGGKVVEYGVEFCKAVAEGNADAGKFPLKVRAAG